MSVLIGKPAPEFDCKAVINGNEIVDSYPLSALKGKYVLLFFYPLDFTFVCPTELHAFQDALGEFESRGVQVVACSVDSWHTHLAWLRTPVTDGGIQGITYPILADLKKTVAEAYDVLDTNGEMAYRGLFLIDKEGVVRHQVVNDKPLGRSTDEALGMVDALQYFEKNGEVCPANWQKGKATMKESHDSVAEYFQKQNQVLA